MTLYFFERITDHDFIGPVVVAASDEPEAWQVLSRRGNKLVDALKDDHWDIAQELAALPARACVVYPSSYRRVAVPQSRTHASTGPVKSAMERRRLGKTDILASVLGFGGAEIGRARVDGGTLARLLGGALARSDRSLRRLVTGYTGLWGRTVARLLGSALDAGLNVIDTAECYAESEQLIGRAIRGRRRDVYLFTKCGHDRTGAADWRSGALLESIERSLRRLQTDYLDVIQLHSCALADLERGEAIAALERARERGWVRYIGYSGDGEAARYAIECGRFDTLQTSVSIADQEALDLTLPRAHARHMGVIVKRPLANIAWHYTQKPESYYEPYWSRLRILDYGFLKSGQAAAVASALRFTLSVPGVHTAIVGTLRPGRWEENAASLRAGPLPGEEFERIRARWRAVADASWVGQP